MTPAILAAIIATVLLGVLIVFQLVLAIGAPLGDMSWGGQHPGVLPRRLRIASAVAGVVIYPAVVAVIFASAGLIQVSLLPSGATAMWVLSAFFLLGTFMNAISRSKRERIWAPVAPAIAACCATIALSL